MDIKVEPLVPNADTIERPETLSTIVSFRMAPSMLERLDTTVDKLWINRSRLIRGTLLGGGLVYVGDEIARELSDCRKTVASVGNLLKLLADELQPLAENPLLAAETREQLLSKIDTVNRTRGDLRDLRERIVKTFDVLHDELEELNRGNL